MFVSFGGCSDLLSALFPILNSSPIGESILYMHGLLATVAASASFVSAQYIY